MLTLATHVQHASNHTNIFYIVLAATASTSCMVSAGQGRRMCALRAIPPTTVPKSPTQAPPQPAPPWRPQQVQPRALVHRSNTAAHQQRATHCLGGTEGASEQDKHCSELSPTRNPRARLLRRLPSLLPLLAPPRWIPTGTLGRLRRPTAQSS